MNNKAHVRFGLVALAVYATVGLVLEAMNGFKLGWYVASETRRLMLTLGHAHGVALGIWNVVYGGTALTFPTERRRALASGALKAATILLPAGFLLGGLRVYGADPGVGFVLLPVGAVLLIGHLVLAALARI
jgi:hypothetical protein